MVKKTVSRIVLIIFCSIYFSLLFYIFFLARRRRVSTLPRYKGRINLVPLKSKIEYLTTHSHLTSPQSREFYTDLLGNIILFIPFAFFLVFVFHIKTLRRILFIALITSVSIEVIQFLLSIGVADIDDIILNMTGATIGAGTLKLLFKLKAFPSYLKK